MSLQKALRFQKGLCPPKPFKTFSYGGVNYQIYSQVILFPYETFFLIP